MSYMMLLLMVGLGLGMIMVASNPSPYFGALGLMVVSGLGCAVLVLDGDVLLPLVLFLIYLGGMLVVFAYSSALASDLFPQSLGHSAVAFNLVSYILMGLICGVAFFDERWFDVPRDKSESEVTVVRAELGAVACIYQAGGALLALTAWVLLVTLFVVLEVVRGGMRGALRAV
uniref:NADH-ubiquinone oxidoreductase chain 6 n=1 Tax=Trimma kudoi TaxID=1402046 RepID=A0A455TNL2_9GOBI|nr:NADH dehydrogenase subunit 6 [Trimma kudoi]